MLLKFFYFAYYIITHLPKFRQVNFSWRFCGILKIMSEYTQIKVFSENLKNLLKENNLSVNKFAKLVNIPRSTLGEYLTNQTDIKLENLCKIADYFDITLDELCGRE